MENNLKKAPLTDADFTSLDRVKACVDKLEQTFHAGNKLIVSDVVDQLGNQYVNLVQKGGGVLGVALVGYTYILERMNIRFMRLAGTSAGAINTALMCAIGTKEQPKSTQVLNIVSQLDFFALVDGHPTARWLIKNFIAQKDFAAKLKARVLILVLGILGLFTADFTLLGLENRYPDLAVYTQICFIATGFILLAIGILVFYFLRLISRLKNSGFGINPGDYFYDWMKARFIENGVKTVTDLENKAQQSIAGLSLREGIQHKDGIEGLKGDVTFITSELVTENKIQFPLMCDLFREKAEIDKLQPAGFVRASMAIPLFFESYFINNIPVESPEIKAAWLNRFNEENPPSSARFVDGGLLSNFPINLFFNPNIEVPRLPTFGIDLDDTLPEDRSKETDNWSFLGYSGRMLNTLRGLYDKDFLIQNKAYKKGIGSISLTKFNWLNFFLEDKDKKEMFALGAEAATEFLMTFNWEQYKDEQIAMRVQMNGGN